MLHHPRIGLLESVAGPHLARCFVTGQSHDGVRTSCNVLAARFVEMDLDAFHLVRECLEPPIFTRQRVVVVARERVVPQRGAQGCDVGLFGRKQLRSFCFVGACG